MGEADENSSESICAQLHALTTVVSFSSVQFSRSVGPTLCDPMNRSTPGLPVHLFVTLP